MMEGLCSPAVISAILGVLSIGSSLYRQRDDFMSIKQPSLMSTIIGSSLFVAFEWGLCYLGYEGAAWFFLLLPFVFSIVAVFALFEWFRHRDRK